MVWKCSLGMERHVYSIDLLAVVKSLFPELLMIPTPKVCIR